MQSNLIALAAAAMVIGCSSQVLPGDMAEGADTGSETDTSLDDECPAASLNLSEGYAGVLIAGVKLPASQGSENHTSGSCGGSGVDQTYRVTSSKTTNYNLSVSSSDGPLTVHLHTGDSCHGPELDCVTGNHASFSLLLVEGEQVTVVVDSEPDLIPEDGLRYSIGISWGPELCDADALHACIDTSVAALEACMVTYACDEPGRTELCPAQFNDDYDLCRLTYCPDGGPTAMPFDACEAACMNRSVNCATVDGCDANVCAYEGQLCMDTCTVCNSAEFSFEYVGGCDLVLPGPPGMEHAPYVDVLIDGESQEFGDPGIACGDPGAEQVVWTSDASVQLCGLACEAYALAGSAQVVYGLGLCE